MKNIRIENIEIRKTNYKNNPYEFLCWQINPYFGKLQEYINNGYEESFGGDFLTKEKLSIQKSYFTYPESCYVIAWMKRDKEGYYMETVGSRLLEISEEELKLFFDIYRKADKKLNK